MWKVCTSPGCGNVAFAALEIEVRCSKATRSDSHTDRQFGRSNSRLAASRTLSRSAPPPTEKAGWVGDFPVGTGRILATGLMRFLQKTIESARAPVSTEVWVGEFPMGTGRILATGLMRFLQKTIQFALSGNS